MYDLYFNTDHEIFRKSVKDFFNKEVIPFIDIWEKEQCIPREIWKKMGEMGYLGLDFGTDVGGVGLDFIYTVVWAEEISKCFSGGFAIAPLVNSYMAAPYIYKYGSDFLKQKYVVPAIQGDQICSIAITEPAAGSDVSNIQTKAVLTGDYYLVNGSKTFITNAYYGDFMVVAVKTDMEAGLNGISLLVMDRNAEGISAHKLDKLGWHASDTASLHFDNVKVPKENLIGEEGLGFYYLMGGLQLERLIGAIMGVGACDLAFQYTLKYMSERTAFNRPINKFQVLRHRMAQLATEMEINKSFVYHCCKKHQEGAYIVKECSMAKLNSTELSDKVMYQCLQSFGGYGFIEDYKIARMFRDSRIGTIGGGTSEIMREILAKIVIDGNEYE
jgi:acyl-CoA dehydrogenase